MAIRHFLATAFLAGLAGPVVAQSTISFPPPVNVSNSNPSTAFTDYRIVVDPDTLQKVHVVTYADGPNGARDIFVRHSVDDGATWSAALNLSNTVGQTNVVGAPGNSSRPSIAAESGNVLIAWIDSYCPGGSQGSYLGEGGSPTAFGCVYTSRSTDSGRSWSSAEQLTDGSRDAINTFPAASPSGFALAWQEDPAGVPADDDGGSSGASGTPGTDIHYSALSTLDFATAVPFPPDTTISDNTGTASGDPAATRPHLVLVDSLALLAYEETKSGAQGKDVLWHDFNLFMPDTVAAGGRVNDPSENARRVRIAAQPAASAGASDTRAIVIWRQGLTTQDGPADLFARRLTGGYGIGQMQAAINLSGSTLGSPSAENPDDSIRGHRAILDGDRLAVVYIYTPSEALRALQQATYNVFTRQSLDGGTSWSTPRNLSGLSNFDRMSFAPRIIKTPASIASGDPIDDRDPLVYVIGWDTRTNQANSEGAERFDVWAAYTTDFGSSFATPIPVSTTSAGEYAIILQAFPSGERICAVWRLRDADTRPDAYHACGSLQLSLQAVPTNATLALALLAALTLLATAWTRSRL
ncbi:sialidase family protein [Wenzhouxiangella marina]|uniref:Uncharacterized protein n=1 Tax=Wenzhouxiangella marina TaxID=1579979 RepID=A0A0K0XYE5_9GAMM|nr:sialidase family protein [Wenzhouxiangella marina]AKS42698.1 hypothetical protein WM2015_2335 [Wenzhouxiangella marina]MBB6088613.1 hypothetical protein [Wenzhouxiangella marina]